MSCNSGLMRFLDASPTPFHAVATMAEALTAAGFTALDESETWSLTAGGRYFTTRNDSSIIAFTIGNDSLVESGWRMLGAHTDSPCLKPKPQPELKNQGYWQLGVEVYGGVLLNPWFDRDLSLAGRVHYQNSGGELCSALIDFQRPVACIPSLAIHLDREANKSRSINPQTDIPPVLMQDREGLGDFRALLRTELEKQGVSDCVQVLDYELSFYDCQGASEVGLEQDFICSARLDNLLSCYLGLEALVAAADAGQHSVLVCNDHEEVGSVSAAGAQGPMLRDCLSRIADALGEGADTLPRALQRSSMISVDNAHGVHPNFADRHDASHGPKLNAGPVIKLNANQRYASNSETSALFRQLCEQENVPVQAFVVRSDMACGSTIGPITAAELGVRTLDIGLPTFAMHSIRETMGSRDADYLLKVATAFYRR